ncbi:MAG: LicD family protein [Ruminococcaceae bacterium]|nr:LicD family protein [Oscillospiraceae bacterium]
MNSKMNTTEEKENLLLNTAADTAFEVLTNYEGSAENLREIIEKKLKDKLDKKSKSDAKLRKLQKTELEVLMELDRVCRKHNLRYYIVGGTLIGAARTGGFIPWDDDIDVSMPREDFNKLLKLKDEFSSDYFLQTHKTEKECYFFYAKLRKNGTYFGEDKFEHTGIHKGIFMDIFPLDYISDKSFIQKLCFKSFSLINAFICSKKKTSEFLYKNMSLPFIVTFRFIQCILPLPLLYGLRSLTAKLTKAFSNKKLIASLAGFHGYPKEISFFELWAEGTDIEFEGKTVRAPKEYKKLLNHMFGDYMQLPPIEERINHTVADENIIFEGVKKEDYKPKFRRKRSHRYYGVDYDIIPLKKQ